jgi:Rrf2 family iron-sulfur cluster assembly transcriptional regulator
MRISLQVHYAICGIFDLAYNGAGGLVQIRVVGERQGIPARYLEQIFQRLRRAELIVGKRGPGGGYTLARPPAEINLRHVVEAVEGPLGEDERWGAEAGDAKPNRPDFLWPEITAGFARVLSATTIEKLCREAAQAAVRRSDDTAYTYQI